MAIIGKIRERMGLLLVVFVGSALLAFVLGDFFNSFGSLLGNNNPVIGEINGNEITLRDFQLRVDKEISKVQSFSNRPSLSQEEKEQQREKVWQEFLNAGLMEGQISEVGIAISADELEQMVKGTDPHPYIRQLVSQNFGEYTPDNAEKFLNHMVSNYSDQWMYLENEILQEKVKTKYNTLLKNGIYFSTKEASIDHQSRNRYCSFDFVIKRYSSVADSLITVTEGDIEDYYNENEHKYLQEESRSIEYVAYDVLPSQDDTAAFLEIFKELRPAFQEAIEDSLFVIQSSDTRRYDNIFAAEGSLSSIIDSLMFNSEVGAIHGPYLEDGYYKMAKLVAIENRPDSVNARHILIKADAIGYEAAKNKADSLRTMLDSGIPFEILANTNSDDPGSKEKGGELGWFVEGEMVAEFNTACFSGKKGDIIVVQSNYGSHIIEILDQKKKVKKVKVAIIDREILPGGDSYDEQYRNASIFAGENQNSEKFDNSITKNGLNKRIADNLKPGEKYISGLDEPRELIRWAYTAEEGDISEVFEIGKKYVVGHLTEIKEEGIAPLDKVYVEVEAAAKRIKKAVMIIDDWNTKLESAGGDLEKFSADVGLITEPVERFSFSTNSIPRIGRETEVIGYIFSMQENEISAPLKGENGVFVISMRSFEESEATEDDLVNAKSRLANNFQYKANYDQVMNALKKKAGVVDNRSLYY